MQVWFIQEVIFNEDFKEHIAGRVEVLTEGAPYPKREIRVFTPKREEFMKWALDLEEKELDESEIEKIVNKIQKEYNIFYEK